MTTSAKEKERLFNAAAELTDPDRRAAFLDAACGIDAQLRAELEELLRHDGMVEGFLSAPVVVRHAAATTAGPGREVPGAAIGPYKLLEQIGEGGFGVVFMAEQTQTVRRRVALKVLKPGMDTRQVVARFEAERQALALMDHPNIARVFDGGETSSGRPYFVMELVKGIPITDYCDQSQLTVRQRLELFLHICQAVQHAHHKGIIHRDLKPANVLVTLHDGTPVVKVIDFGIAKVIGQQLTEKTLFTNFAQLIGTPLYMSPEQAALSGLDVDTRSDVYSLGVLLYELLTGTTPFDQDRLRTAGYDEMRRIIREEEPARPSTRFSTPGPAATAASAQRRSDPRRLSRLVRGELDWIVMKALEKDRNRRYETASAFAADIQRYLNDEPVHACPPSLLYRMRKLAGRHRASLATAGVVLVALVLATGVSAWQALRATSAERKTRAALAQMSTAQAQTRKALDTLFDNVVETMFTRQSELEDAEKAFLRKVADLYEDIARQSGESAQGWFLRGEGHFKVAHLRGLLGEQAAAASGYHQAETLLEQLATEFPAEAEYRLKLARLEGNFGIHLAELGKEAESEAAFRRGIALRSKLAADFPKNARYRLELANNYNDLGYLLERQNNLPEAEKPYRESIRLKETLATEAGAEPRYSHELAHTRAALGGLLRKQEKYAEAEQLYRRALSAFQTQPDQVPLAPKYRASLASMHHGLGIVLAEQKKEADAETEFRRTLEIRKKLVEEFPKVVDYRRELANDTGDLAELLSREGKTAPAEESCRQALALRERIVAERGTVPRYRRELAQEYDKLGEISRDSGRTEEAEVAWRSSLTHWEALGNEWPKVPDYQFGLASTLMNLAELRMQRNKFAEALPLLETAQAHFRVVLEAGSKNPMSRQGYRDHLLALAKCCQQLGDHARLAAIADDLAGFEYEPPRDLFSAASILCRGMRLVKGDVRLAEARRQELAESYADRALALLQRAVARGFKDAARLKQDPDLEPLRARDAFRKLLPDLERNTPE